MHCIDLVPHDELTSLGEDRLVTTLTGLIWYIRCEQNIQAEIKTVCLKFFSTRWLLKKLVTTSLAQHPVRFVPSL